MSLRFTRSDQACYKSPEGNCNQTSAFRRCFRHIRQHPRPLPRHGCGGGCITGTVQSRLFQWQPVGEGTAPALLAGGIDGDLVGGGRQTTGVQEHGGREQAAEGCRSGWTDCAMRPVG